MPTILIGGDVVPKSRTLPLFEALDAAALFGDLLPHFEAADLTLVNLECPLIERESPIEKTGPVLGAPARCARTLAVAGVDAVTLANNHILDHGRQGLESTIRACEEAGIATFGAGDNREAAGRMLIRSVEGCRVGMLGMAEHEWSIAGRRSCGAAGLDLASFMRTVRENQGAYDFLVVLLHAGAEHHPYPTPRQMEVCRFLVEEGAGAVVCQHSHCLGAYEEYRGAPILYGQGNLLFDTYPEQRQTTFYTGALMALEVGADGAASTELLPYVQCAGRAGARLMEPGEARTGLAAVKQRSQGLQEEAYVKQKWEEYCAAREKGLLSQIHGHGNLLRRVHHRVGWLRTIYSPEKRGVLLNLVRCESHREIIETICGST